MTVKTEGLHRGGYLVSEANGTRSREKIIVAEGELLGPGAVLAKQDADGKYVAYDADGTDGVGQAAAILYDHVDASDGDVEAVAHVRDCEVNAGELDWGENDTEGIVDGIADLEAIGIIPR